MRVCVRADVHTRVCVCVVTIYCAKRIKDRSFRTAERRWRWKCSLEFTRSSLFSGKDRKRIFIRLKQTYLDSHQIATYSGLTSYRCIFHCLNDYRCLSINWNVHRSLDNCQLNNATRWEDNEVLITHQTEQINPALWYYYETSYPAYGN